jgi:serine/threonine protein kinase
MLRGLIDRVEVERYRNTVLPVLNQLEHPGLVRVYDCGTRGMWVYLVQEFLPSGSLRHWIGSEPQPVRETAAVVESLARTMQAVHDHGLVHGNLEPANVMLEADGTPRIAEVGLVNQPRQGSTRQVEEEILRTMQIDRPVVVGNARFLAPEVIYGATGPQSDIYGLGGIMYYMLTGRPPVEGDSFHDVMAQSLNQGPVPLRQLRPEVPPDLEAVCLKCLQKNQQQRFASAGALAEELRGFLDGGPGGCTLVSEAKPTPPSSIWHRFLGMLRPRPTQ